MRWLALAAVFALGCGVESQRSMLRVLSEQTSLATIILTVTEVKDYVPEEPPGYGERVARAFRTSIEALVRVGQEVSIAIVALAPWLGVLLVLALVLWLLWRLVRRFCRGKPIQAEVVAQSQV